MKSVLSHEEKVARIVAQLKEYKKLKSKKKIRFSHGSTNSTRVQDKSNNYLIDISELNQILKVDKQKKVAIVEPNVPMDVLVDECLKQNMLPKVVMEFPGITVGGGINGGALEASSFLYGQFNDTCIEYECIIADGSIITANKNKNADLFYGISGTYGSLGLLSKITISLIPAKPYVEVSFIPVQTDTAITAMQKIIKKKTNEYLDGIIYDKEHAVLITGNLTSKKKYSKVTFSRASDEWFYLYTKKFLDDKKPTTITVPIKDFLFRYDRGAFWMGKHAFALFHTPFTKTMRRILNPLFDTRTMYKALHRTNAAQISFIQDFYIPLSQTKQFIEFSINESAIFPLWICPIMSTKTPQYMSPHFLKEPMLIDVGIWGNIPKDKNLTTLNKKFEDFVQTLGGRKMLYAEAFYSENVFWKIYDRAHYSRLRKKYKAVNSFPDVWEKVHVKKRYAVNKWLGVGKTIAELVAKKIGF